MAYTFRFQALLKYREFLLTRAQTDLATAMNHFAAAQNLLEKAIVEREQTLLLFQEKQHEGIIAAEYHVFQDYLVSLEQQLLKMQVELQGLSREVETAKENLLRRRKELKMLEVIEAKDRSAFHREQAKREQTKQSERAAIGDYRKRTER